MLPLAVGQQVSTSQLFTLQREPEKPNTGFQVMF
jgi:hypothetical protein